jgi:hypothetical protein
MFLYEWPKFHYWVSQSNCCHRFLSQLTLSRIWSQIFAANLCLFRVNKVELGYKVMKGTEYFVSLQMSVVLTKECTVMVNSEKLIRTIQYLTLYTRCSINWCCYNRVRLYLILFIRFRVVVQCNTVYNAHRKIIILNVRKQLLVKLSSL